VLDEVPFLAWWIHLPTLFARDGSRNSFDFIDNHITLVDVLEEDSPSILEKLSTFWARTTVLMA